MFVLSALLLSAGVLVQAQPGGGRGGDPVQRAEQTTADMTAQMGLSEPQAAKVREINLKYAEKIKKAREESDGDWEAMRATMGTIRQEQDTELQTVVTEEQWQKWVAYREAQRAQHANGQPSHDAPPPPPPPPPPGDPNAKPPKKVKSKSNN